MKSDVDHINMAAVSIYVYAISPEFTNEANAGLHRKFYFYYPSIALVLLT